MKLIIHIDLDSFYASVEELRHPEIRGKPVVICMYSGRGKDSGAVATANYPARKLGIGSGMPLRTAKARASKETIFLPADREFYRKVSDRIMVIFRSYADSFEQRSIDEAYLDVSSCKTLKSAELIAKKIKAEVLKKEKLTCSAGIGPNKLVAKMASREQKPDGLTIVREGEWKKFLDKPVDKLFGIGPKTLAVLQKFKVKTIRDLSRLDKDLLIKEFGERKGHLFHEHSLGRDSEPVSELIKQQLSRMKTIPKDSKQFKEIFPTMQSMAKELHKNVKAQDIKFRTISIIMINTYMGLKTRSKSLPKLSSSLKDILDCSKELLKVYLKENPKDVMRRVGVKVSSLDNPEKQKSLTEFRK